MIAYHPKMFIDPSLVLDVPSAWSPSQRIIQDIITRFGINPEIALDLGVDYGYSTSVLANYFHHVIAVDIFGSEQEDAQTGYRDPDMFERVAVSLKDFPVTLVRSDVREWMKQSSGRYDLIHIDLFHSADLTRDVARWAIQHTDVVLAHDIVAYPEVAGALEDVASESGLKLYGWTERFGLGILTRREPQ